MLAMARDVLTCLSKSSKLTSILIVSRAPEADALAQAFATERFAESPDANLPEALEQATQHLIANFQASGVFVVPADVPAIKPGEVDELLEKHTSVTVLPDDEHIGTNGLICSPPLIMPYIFDGKSFKPHVDGAFERGITTDHRARHRLRIGHRHAGRPTPLVRSSCPRAKPPPTS